VHNNDEGIHREYLRRFIANSQDGSLLVKGMYKLVDDPRVTPFGRFIRRTSIDELPQMINVLRGEMSLVGPRPPIPYEVENYQEWHRLRLEVKPGLTGLWQVYGRSVLPFNESVFLDLCYVFGRNLALDINLILRTFPIVLFGRGAY